MKREERIISHTFTTAQGNEIVLHGLPTYIDVETNDIIGYRVSVSSKIGALVQQAEAQGLTDIHFQAAELLPSNKPDAVSLELRRALRDKGMTGAEIAKLLNIKPPLVSRWLNPNYHQHNIETLRRIADILGMEVKVTLEPKAL